MQDERVRIGLVFEHEDLSVLLLLLRSHGCLPVPPGQRKQHQDLWCEKDFSMQL